ncbi:MAG: PAS domain S-box protein [Rhodocyclales bacterium]|nr:PAS domain S-box protein [Rhodocyclales bacterium]
MSASFLRQAAANRSFPAALAICVVGVLSCLVYWLQLLDTQREVRAGARSRNEQRAAQVGAAASQQVDAMLRSVDVALSHLRSVYVHERHEFDRAVRDVLAAYPAGMLQFVTVFGPDGYLAYASNGSGERIYFGDREHFRVHADGGADRLFISQPIVGRIAGIPLIQLTRPIRAGQRFLGVIGIPLRPDYISSRLAALHFGQQGFLSVVRPDGSIIARSRGLAEALRTKLPPDRPFLAAAPGSRGVFRDVSAIDGVPLLFAWERSAQWPLSVVVAIDEEAELADISAAHGEARRRALGAMALIVALTLGIAALLLRMGSQNEALARGERRFRALFDDAKITNLLIDPKDGCIVEANAAACRYYGYDQATLRRMRISDINTLPAAKVAEEMRRAQAEERSHYYFKHRLAGGEIRDVEVHSGPIEVDGRTLLFSVIHDVTQRRRVEAENRQLIQAVNQSPVSIVMTDLDGNIVFVNDAFVFNSGYEREEVLGRNPRFLKSGETPPDAYRDLWATITSGRTWHGEFHNRRKNGGLYWEAASISPVVDSQGRVSHFIGVKENIGERKRAEAGQRLAASVFSHAHEGIVICDAAETIVDVNPTFSELSGYTREEAIGRTPRILSSGRHGKDFYRELWQAVAQTGHWEGEIWNRRKNGEVYAEHLNLSSVADAHGKVTHYIGTFSDVTVLKRRQHRLEFLAHYDALTLLPNRLLLADRLQQGIAQARRADTQLAVCYLDLDDFKPINDRYGHAAGDAVLIEVAARLRLAVRAGDTVARLGGDEFVLVLVGVDGIEDCETSVQRILTAVATAMTVKGHAVGVTASIGFTLFPADDGPPDALLRHADLAMYIAKQQGRNRCHRFEPARDGHGANRAEP